MIESTRDTIKFDSHRIWFSFPTRLRILRYFRRIRPTRTAAPRKNTINVTFLTEYDDGN